jgi:hypothetical protein
MDCTKTVSRTKQGDQIGRTFVQWVIVYFRQFSENYKSSPHFWCYLLLSMVHLDKNVLGYILGEFFSQTHLVALAQRFICRRLYTWKGGGAGYDNFGINFSSICRTGNALHSLLNSTALIFLPSFVLHCENWTFNLSTVIQWVIDA